MNNNMNNYLQETKSNWDALEIQKRLDDISMGITQQGQENNKSSWEVEEKPATLLPIDSSSFAP